MEKTINLPEKTYEKLEYAAKQRHLTPEQLASRIVLENALRRSCIGCGLEAEDKSGHPSVETAPCVACSRNPAIKDRWNEAWTTDEGNIPFIER